MAKFELPIYDARTGEICKTVKRNFMPSGLYIRFQKVAEKISGDSVKSDEEMFDMLEDLFLEMFRDLTKEEYQKQTDIAEILMLWAAVLNKSTQIAEGDSKNV